MADEAMYKICVYIPEESLEAVKSAMFAAGAGKIGDYEKCCWQCRGEGQFMPLQGSNPSQGEIDTLETLVEFKVEMVCETNVLQQVIAALRESHPYEEPAFQYWQVNA